MKSKDRLAVSKLVTNQLSLAQARTPYASILLIRYAVKVIMPEIARLSSHFALLMICFCHQFYVSF